MPDVCPLRPRRAPGGLRHPLRPALRDLAQRRGFRDYLQGLLLPRERNKTLTALAGAEPITQAQAAPVQRLQLFLSESPWESGGERSSGWRCSAPTRRPRRTTTAS